METMVRVNKLSGSLHAILDPCTHKFRSRISIQVRSHTVTQIFPPRSLIDIIVHVVINAEAMFRVVFPLACELTLSVIRNKKSRVC